MQKKAAQRCLGGSAVKAVAHDRMADAGEVYADLVRAASSDLNLEQRAIGETPQDAILAPRLAALGHPRRHAHAPHRVASDRLLDPSTLRLDHSVHQSEIRFADTAGGELPGQTAMGAVGLGDQQHSTG